MTGHFNAHPRAMVPRAIIHWKKFGGSMPARGSIRCLPKQRIPTLAEVFQQIGSRLWVDVEIKSDWLHREPPGLLEEKVT